MRGFREGFVLKIKKDQKQNIIYFKNSKKLIHPINTR